MTSTPHDTKHQERSWLGWISLLCAILMLVGLVCTRSDRSSEPDEQVGPTQEELVEELFEVLELEQCTAMSCNIYMDSVVILKAWHYPDIVDGNRTYTFAITQGDLYNAMRRLACTPTDPCWASSEVITSVDASHHVINLGNNWNTRDVRLRVEQ